MYPLYYEKKIIKKLIQYDALILLADGFNELNILALFIFYYQNKSLWYDNPINNKNIFFDLFKLNINRISYDNEENKKDTNYSEKLDDYNEKSEHIKDTFKNDENENTFDQIKNDNNENCNLNNIGNKNKLIFILNVTPKEYNLFLKYQIQLYEEISKLDKLFNNSVKINYLKTEYIRNQKSNERIEMYIKRGVYFISSNVLLIDLLTFKIIPEIIDGIFICKNHKLICSTKEVFIIEIFRRRNKFGFIKGISNNKKLINNQHILNISQKLFMKKIYCYPRFHKNVHISLNNKYIQPNIYELNLDLPIDTKKIEDNIFNLIHYLNLEIKKFHTFDDFDINSLMYSDSAENYIMNYIKSKNLTYNTKKLLKEIIVLVNILYNLYNYDSLIFYNYLNNLKEADKESIWMYCNEANEIFYLSSERKNNFLKKINIDKDQYGMDDIQCFINKIQYNSEYFYNSYKSKREENEKYKWIYELVYNRDISLNDYKKIILKRNYIEKNCVKRKNYNKNYENNKIVSKKIKTTKNVHSKCKKESELYLNNEEKKGEIGKSESSNINFKIKCENYNLSNEYHIIEKNDFSQKVDINENTVAYNCEEINKEKKIEINEDRKLLNNELINNKKEEIKIEKNTIHNNDSSDSANIDKIDYPIVIIVDNFYAQKEIYNLLIHKKENNLDSNFPLKYEEKINEYNISDSSMNSLNSSEKSFKSKKNFFLENINYYISYNMIKNKTLNLKYIKPKIYILCINKYYDNIYTSENFINNCYKKIDMINLESQKNYMNNSDKEKSKEKKDNEKGNSNHLSFDNDDIFEINEFSGNLDFLELFLMKIKPHRIILTNLDLSIFRNIEIYCARLFRYHVFKLHKEECFKELAMYEKNNLMYDNFHKDNFLIKKEEILQKEKSNNNNYKTIKKIERNKEINNFKIIRILSDMCNTVEVFLIFYKNSVFYNRYLNNIKIEKNNWLNFIENKNNLRFEVDRNIFNKNEELFKKVINSYFLFQKKFKENKKNLVNFNKALCEEFKKFQEVKTDEKIENKNVLVNSLNSNFISMEEEDIFIENYKYKINKKSEIVTFDEKIIQKIQEVLHNFSIDSFNLNFILYSIFNNTKPIIIVDIRELKSDLSYKLYRSKMHIIPYSLLVGDYILTKNICVERKTIVDLIQSLNNNRLHNQINQMSKYYSIYVLLIEFNNKHLFYFSSLNDKYSIYTKLIILCLQFSKLKILWSPFSLFTVKLFWSLKVNSEQPDIFKSLHIDITLQKNSHQQVESYQKQKNKHNEENKIIEISEEKKKNENFKEILNKEEIDIKQDEKEKTEKEKTEKEKTEKENNNKGHTSITGELMNEQIYGSSDDESMNIKDCNYETINDLFDKNLNNINKLDNEKIFKKVENATNWNAIEILKSLPGVTEKNMHLIINNVNSLYDLCEKKLEELENYMSKNNAKLLYEFLNTNVS
ncbi:DNA repair endonuclease, putative [Plasmodium gallinaceum]|uniref:DNA repair endonuclease, putative n=1 Tax=Plasmodium gallinaceum TaxID=5849 RepID=A0A1J1GP23_PLAGA|nr:DNA repair endonuclease, putative [Plasmodium gallinaceum]CRG94046.1 DNA repair endonuclease, putative [Plasmodium gallinaceum]